VLSAIATDQPQVPQATRSINPDGITLRCGTKVLVTTGGVRRPRNLLTTVKLAAEAKQTELRSDRDIARRLMAKCRRNPKAAARIEAKLVKHGLQPGVLTRPASEPPRRS
jgi:hypothetical protein